MNRMKKNLMLIMLKNNKTNEENLIKIHILKEVKGEDGKKTERNYYLIILNFHTMDVRYVTFKCIINFFFFYFIYL